MWHYNSQCVKTATSHHTCAQCTPPHLVQLGIGNMSYCIPVARVRLYMCYHSLVLDARISSYTRFQAARLGIALDGIPCFQYQNGSEMVEESNGWVSNRTILTPAAIRRAEQDWSWDGVTMVQWSRWWPGECGTLGGGTRHRTGSHHTETLLLDR